VVGPQRAKDAVEVRRAARVGCHAADSLREQVGDAVEEEFRLRALAAAEAQRADDRARPVLGPTTLRTQRVSTRTLR
jgi:hypothetical protein